MTFVLRGRRALAAVVVLLATMVPAALAASRPAAADPAIAFPNIQVLVPTNRISIAQPTSSTRTLDFTHVTWNAGAGPLEIRPQFDPTTGLATATQALYTLTGPSTWSFVKTVPIVKPMVWDPPTDYRFPLTGFGLYSVGSGGGVGSLVASSPKVDFCMTPDTFVGGVPNTTSGPVPDETDCDDPNGVLGLSVGWGDEYDYTDAGNNIDISNLPNGTYWLRAQADPGNYFTQSGTNESITDTELSISGTSVTVLQQVNPVVNLPSVAITSPAAGSTVTAPTTFTASVSDASPVTSLQFLLDGVPVGAPETQAPYSVSIPSLTPGPHMVSAQAVDQGGLTGTAPGVAITVPLSLGQVQVDQQVNASGSGPLTTAKFSTRAANELLVALVGADAPLHATQTAKVTGAGLTWTLASRADGQPGDAEIWTAPAPSPLTNVSVTSSTSVGTGEQSLTVLALENATGVGATATGGAKTGAPSISLKSTAAGSLAIGTGNDYDSAAGRTVGPNQQLVQQFLDTSSGDTYWSQATSAPSTGAGQTLTLNDTSPTKDHWNLAGIEVLAGSGSSAPVPPAVAITAPTGGQTVSGTVTVKATVTPPSGATVKSVQLLVDGQPVGSALTAAPYTFSWDTTGYLNGSHTVSASATDSDTGTATSTPVPVTVNNGAPATTVSITTPTAGQTVSGTIPVTATVNSPSPTASVQFMLDGQPLGAAQTTSPYSISWDTRTALDGPHTLVAVATDPGGVQTGSTPVMVTVENGDVCFNTDVNVSAHGRGPVTTDAFHTATSSELLLAFVGSDGPQSGGQTVTVSGAGLTWTLVKRSNSAPGDAEIWQATSTSVLTNAQVKATQSKTGFDMFLNVIALQGTAGIGASAGAGATTGAPHVSLTTLGSQSLVFGVGNDWSRAVSRTAGANQVIENQFLDTATGDTYWSQNTSVQSGAAGSSVTLNDTAPTNDNWNLVAVEVESTPT